MAFTFGFYNSLKGDRRYNAEQFGEIFDGILRDGIFASIGQAFAVTTANNGMQINVGTGRAWFNHTWSKNDSVMVLTVPNSDTTRARYDAVVLEINATNEVRENSIKIVRGNPLVNPVKPELVNTDKIHQYPLAYILVGAGVTTIAASKIENAVGLAPTVFATGVLEAVKLDDLWAQWKGEFTEWFDNVKAQLSGNIATNLQNQIDAVRASVPAKATNTETTAGTNTTKYTTPSGVKAAIDANMNYVSNNYGTKFKLVERDILPRLKPDAITRSSITIGLYRSNMNRNTVHLKDYDVTHIDNHVLIIDKLGQSREYTVSCTVPTDDYTKFKYICAIKNTNNYIAIGESGSNYTLYRIVIGQTSPTVSQYYSWPKTDGSLQTLMYANTNYSVLVLQDTSRWAHIRVYRISNLYAEQPVIYTIVCSSYYSQGYSFLKTTYAISGNYVVQLRYDRGNAAISTTGQCINIMDGSISSPVFIRSVDYGGNNYVNQQILLAFSDSNGKCYFLVRDVTSASVGTCFLVTVTNQSFTHKILSNLNSYTSSLSSLDSSSTSIMVDEITAYIYVYNNSSLKACRIDCRSGGTETIFSYPKSESSVLPIHGTGSYVGIQFKNSDTYVLVHPTLTGDLTGLEVSQIFTQGNEGYVTCSTRSIPYVMYHDRYLYCYDYEMFTIDGTGQVRYDLESRTFIGVPV